MRCTFGVGYTPMKRFSLSISDELHDWLTRNMSGHGLTNLSDFIRVILTRFKKQEQTHRWTDADMKDWARQWHRATSAGDKPYHIQDPEIKIREEFEKFKSNRA